MHVTDKFCYVYLLSYGHIGNEDGDFVIFKQYKTHAQLKEKETFLQYKLKTFYPIGLNEQEEYLY